MAIDLHLHSTCSDGTLSPRELVILAKKNGLDTIALTDHDTVEGVPEALKQGIKDNIEVLTGIELSAGYKSLSIHILGYGLNAQNPGLLAELNEIQKSRNIRNQKILQKLQDIGLNVSLKELASYSQTGQTGRPHFARMLVGKGIVSSVDQAFKRYLGLKGKAYVPRKILPVDQAIEYLIKAGGVAVLAHPVTLDPSGRSLPELIENLKKLGLAGVEVYYPNHSPKFRAKLFQLCKKYNLSMTAGSDFHTPSRFGTRLGCINDDQSLPQDIVKNLKERLTAAENHPNCNKESLS